MLIEKTKQDIEYLQTSFQLSDINLKCISDQDKSPTPFVKWVGGKRSIIRELICRLPKSFNGYYEPMVGGGALFYEIFNRTDRAFLSDVNEDLITTYQVVQQRVDELIKKLKEHEENHDPDYYYKIRKQHSLKDALEIAARFIYLNKTCYNGLYRVNKAGRFNVPIGRYKNPGINNEENLRLCSAALQKATIKKCDFDEIEPEAGDFVYFDPPYHPTCDISFTKYDKNGFNDSDQQRLHDLFVSLDKKGVYCMLSNSNTTFINKMYEGFKRETVSAPRMVNCKPNKRGSVEELVIRNYE